MDMMPRPAVLSRILVLAGALGLVSVAAFAAPPGGGSSTGGGPSGVPESRRLQRDVSGDPTVAQRGLPPGIVFSGRVADAAGAPLAAVVLKLFVNGAPSASATTDGDGSFSLDANPMADGSDTTVLWFESPDPERLLDVAVVVHAGSMAQERGLFSPCAARVEMIGGSAKVEVTMMTPEERRESVIAAGCLD